MKCPWNHNNLIIICKHEDMAKIVGDGTCKCPYKGCTAVCEACKKEKQC